MDNSNNIQTQNQQQFYPMPRIGDQAPAFEAVTTQGKIRFPEDFKGKWKILFSHPADFTPVCTSEFMTFASRAAEFEALNTQLIGLSVDGLYSHIAWLRITMDIARKYGMIQPGESATQAVRAVFFIDPKNVIRTIIYYPLSLGRNFDELKRVLIGLQTADEFGVALPADWQPGDEVIVPTAGSCGVAKSRMDGEDRMDGDDKDLKCYDWFFCTRQLPKEKIEDKIYRK